ncbi:hypothetical protein FRC10_006669 [Ceratobasidium sp. 414]|nr:hypothetical protein FRC10_006669 [Ceratobasidium sp. 414]
MLVFTSLLAFVAYVAAQADPSISTPAAVVQCQPAQISFTASHTPVFISIIPGGQPSATPLEDLGQQSASPFTWIANIAEGTSITFQIRDSTGAVAYSAPVTIQNGSDSSCIGQNPSGSGSPTATAPGPSSSASASGVSTPVSSPSSSPAPSSSVVVSTSSAAQSTSSPVTSPVSTRPTASGSSTRAASATSATPSASTSPNAARTNAKVGLAGLLGLAAAVVMA